MRKSGKSARDEAPASEPRTMPREQKKPAGLDETIHTDVGDKESQLFRQFLDGLRSEDLTARHLQTLIAKLNDEYFLRSGHNTSSEEGYAPGTGAKEDLDDDLAGIKDRFNSLLDDVMLELRASPDLEEELRAHEVFSEIAKMLKTQDEDPVAAEIAREVTIKWADRKKPEFKGLAWKKNASTFIAHVYAKWISQGTLRQSHLRADGKLYKAYYSLITRAPEWDLNLPKKEYVRLDDPEEALAHFRRMSREKSRRHTQKRIT